MGWLMTYLTVGIAVALLNQFLIGGLLPGHPFSGIGAGAGTDGIVIVHPIWRGAEAAVFWPIVVIGWFM